MSTNNFSHVGVNIFGASNWEDQSAMIGKLFQLGIRRFRVNNIGGWPAGAYSAIDQQTGALPPAEHSSVSVYVPSQYFAGQFSIDETKTRLESWSHIKHWFIQLDACDPVDTGSPVYCSNPTESGLQNANLDEYTAQIRTAVTTIRIPTCKIDYVIPYQSAEASPAAILQKVKQATVDAFPNVDFYLEKTEYPFWAGSTNTDFPFEVGNTFHDFATSQGFKGGCFAESGWPRACTKKPDNASLSNQCAYLKSLLGGSFSSPDFVAYWWVMGGEDVGDGCGPESWGLFNAQAALMCPQAFKPS